MAARPVLPLSPLSAVQIRLDGPVQRLSLADSLFSGPLLQAVQQALVYPQRRDSSFPGSRGSLPRLFIRGFDLAERPAPQLSRLRKYTHD